MDFGGDWRLELPYMQNTWPGGNERGKLGDLEILQHLSSAHAFGS